jgi:hypothetical protein
MYIIYCTNCRRLYINETGYRRINEDWNLIGGGTKEKCQL